MKQQLNINNIRPKKSLGQNFITDKNFLEKINSLIPSDHQTTIIEIGPGHGALTKYLAKKKFKSLFLIEKDLELSKRLYEIYKNNKKVNVLQKDALKFDYNFFNLERKVILVGNLPFNISTQLLFKWLETESWPPFYDKLILMFQKEVAERIISEPNCKKYGKISVMAQSRCNIKKLLEAPAKIFIPIPKVDGVILELIPTLKFKHLDLKKLQLLLEKAFSQRRKKIKSNLKEYLSELNKLNIDENLRAENLSVMQYCKLTSQL